MVYVNIKAVGKDRNFLYLRVRKEYLTFFKGSALAAYFSGRWDQDFDSLTNATIVNCDP
jgi:hypothetical protein